MRAVVQRVSGAWVSVGQTEIARVGRGVLALIGVEAGDGEADCAYIAEKLSGLRIFEDAAGKLNLSLLDVGGEALLVSQFTLLGDARKGRRPGFSAAARPEEAKPLFELTAGLLSASIAVKTGAFGEDMAVGLVNDGPVTILLDSRKIF